MVSGEPLKVFDQRNDLIQVVFRESKPDMHRLIGGGKGGLEARWLPRSCYGASLCGDESLSQAASQGHAVWWLRACFAERASPGFGSDLCALVVGWARSLS